MKLVDINK